ncbi:MAG TPA: transglutaminase-like domain-containing protein [Phycisphaerae bacterium]|nr:transglutaminase-like domain-containing protein [Phycisphaerae bacterium]
MRSGLIPRLFLLAWLSGVAVAVRAADAPGEPLALSRAHAAWTTLERNQGRTLPGTVLIEPTRTVEASLGFAAELPNLIPTSWVAYAAIPPTLPSQRLLAFNISPRTMQVSDERVPSRKLLMALSSASAGDDSHTLKMGAFYRVQLFKRTLIDGSFKSQGLSDCCLAPPDELAPALAPTETLDFDTPAFQDAVAQNDLRPHPGEMELDFVRRVFTTLKTQLHYEYRADLERRSSAVWRTRTSDCGGLNGLFAAVLRANGIPARVLCGRWARSATDGEMLGGVPYAQWHVKAEFYLPRVGWIPADLSGAVQCTPHNDTGLAYFGNDHGDFITMHTDFDLEVDALRLGHQHILANQGFAYWVTGTGTMTGQSSHEIWKVRELSGVVAAR